MNIKFQLTRVLALSLLLAVGFVAVVMLVGNKRIAKFDERVISAVQGMESPGWTSIMKFFTTIGSGFVVALLTLLLCIFLYAVLKHRQELIFLVAVVGGTGILNLMLKLLFQRDRPTLHRLIEITGYSFPSGHSMAAFALYGALTYLLWRHIPSTWGRSLQVSLSSVFILAIGLSRIYLGVHYPSDVVGGYLASGTFLGLFIWVFERRKSRKAGSYQ
jgi:undecaprenyl-diphosphatase